VSLSVNLSAADITDALLLEDMVESITASGVDPHSVLFEIAEGTLLLNLAEGREWIANLARLGCRFVLDEFGTGLGVFVLLSEDNVTQVKLSRTIVEALRESRESRAFVRSVRELIESQGKSAVAAFIETEAMLAEVVEAGFEFSQGYAVCEPQADLAWLVTQMGAAKSS
jgi:EAL domain-containing protein (putative c-di-GMP-specific phosphodiesterase class I)